MDTPQISVIGGRIQYKHLTSTLDERTFDIGKAHIWMNMITNYQRPTKWLKPTKKGSAINFDYIKTQDEVETAFDELEMYIREVNRKHGTDLALHRDEKVTAS